jgi:hypothetical protein
MSATCAEHPTERATGSCERCGRFVCARDERRLGEKVFCVACSARPEVDYLEALRLKHWGKRDGWVWLFGLSGLVGCLAFVGLVGALFSSVAQVVPFALQAAAAVVELAFFFGQRWARTALMPAVVGSLLAGVVWGAFSSGSVEAMASGGMLLAIAVVMTGSAVFGARTKLFFKLDPGRAALQRLWSLTHDNPIARSSAVLGLVGFVMPPFAPTAVVCGVIGLRRVNPKAWPPVGLKGYAVTGLVLGALGTVMWVLVIVGALLPSLFGGSP